MRLVPLLASFLLSLCAIAAALAASPSDTTDPANRPAVTLELFTSQSCSSCPRAERNLAAYADRPDLVVLEWHVDYWDDLVHGRAGRWRDPYSDPAFTRRQRVYNQKIRQTQGVYTPQLVVGGTAEMTGLRRSEIDRLLAPTLAKDPAFTIAVQPHEDGLQVALDGTVDRRADVLVVDFQRGAVTDVERGENHGRTLTNTHIVRTVRTIGIWDGGASSRTFALPAPADLDCAILIQEQGQGPVLGARYCPMTR